jgi:hypothetical protein
VKLSSFTPFTFTLKVKVMSARPVVASVTTAGGVTMETSTASAAGSACASATVLAPKAPSMWQPAQFSAVACGGSPCGPLGPTGPVGPCGPCGPVAPSDPEHPANAIAATSNAVPVPLENMKLM